MSETYFGVQLAISSGGWQGDFVTDQNGQPLFDVDTFDSDSALRGTLMRMFMQVPRVLVNGNYIGDPDDPFHPDDGVGLPMLVDQLWTVGLQAEITSRILEGMATIADVLDDPPPTVTLSMVSPGYASIVVGYTRITGETRTLPPISLSVSGG